MRLLKLAVLLAVATAGFADTITLKTGRVINGTFLGGTARQVRIEVSDQVQTFDISDVQKIEFSAGAPTAQTAAPAPRPAPAPAAAAAPAPRRIVLRPETVPAPAPPPARGGSLELPAGTNLVIRMIDGVDSETSAVGQTFAASLDEAVVVNNQTVIPRGADVVVKLVDSKDSGKLTGRAELALNLQSVKVNDRIVAVNTESVTQVSDSRGEQTAKVAGGAAVIGSIIGAIAGGGKGAALGAAAGGAAGAGAQVITKGQRVRIPSESRLTFVLDSPVKI